MGRVGRDCKVLSLQTWMGRMDAHVDAGADAGAGAGA